ncbi:hypothetical protein AWM68_12900 [Fictibacillus phosphorivorans]|uniref:histidine kinase n=1 Tax=Fictibacillus phosphorivorans TaxID=1221500 RepID=A0A163PRE0_9BACL|nr:transporter substrate-binding domain-containing protein [Fictibacillus phosphorivorans]KZE64003.1 hypothetical protein AWM68_12900 [Fictibacillus phosphorivorans]
MFRQSGLTIILFFFLSFSVSAKEKEVLRAGYNSEFPPFSYVNKNGKPAGFMIDLARQIEEDQGINLILIPQKPHELSQSLVEGTTELALGLSYNAEADKVLDFSTSVFTMSDALIVLKDNTAIYQFSDLSQQKVVLTEDIASEDMLASVRKVKTNMASSQPAAIKVLESGRSDAWIGNPWTARFYMKNDQIKPLDIRVSALQTYEYSIAFKDGRKETLVNFNHTLEALKQSKDWQTIYNKWFNPYKSEQGLSKTMMYILASVILTILAIAILITYWNYRLKKEVSKKTKALNRSFAFQEQVLNSLDTAIVSFNNEGYIRLVNDKGKNLIERFEKEELHMNDHWLLKQLWNQLEFQNEVVREELHFTQNGEDHTMEYEILPLMNEKQENVGWTAIIEDVSDRVALQRKLVVQEKLKALGQLAAGIAHELRNPLTSMKVFIDLLPTKFDNPRYRKELMKHVPSEIDRLNGLVTDLLDYTRRQEPVKEWVPIKELIATVVHSFQIKLPGNIYHFKLEIDDDIQLNCDKHRIKQVFINLVANAVDAVKDSSQKVITISLHVDDMNQKAIFSVKDTGKGIPEMEKANLFQPFFTTKGDGVGLGLYISYNIIQDHSAEIEVQSVEGSGTQVHILFNKEDVS